MRVIGKDGKISVSSKWRGVWMNYGILVGNTHKSMLTTYRIEMTYRPKREMKWLPAEKLSITLLSVPRSLAIVVNRIRMVAQCELDDIALQHDSRLSRRIVELINKATKSNNSNEYDGNAINKQSSERPNEVIKWHCEARVNSAMQHWMHLCRLWFAFVLFSVLQFFDWAIFPQLNDTLCLAWPTFQCNPRYALDRHREQWSTKTHTFFCMLRINKNARLEHQKHPTSFWSQNPQRQRWMFEMESL